MSETKNTAELGESKGSLGLISLVALVVANMIGVGVFTSSGYSMATLGNPGRAHVGLGIVWRLGH
ncbi:MAG: hypothetical protein U0930_12025 [Pirellulales bacterium]